METVLFAGMTSFSTAVAAYLAALAYRSKMRPFIRSEVVKTHGDLVYLHLRIHPAQVPLRITRISGNGEKMALLERIPGGVYGEEPSYEVLREGASCRVDVDIELPPLSFARSGECADVYLSISWRKRKSRWYVSFHTERSLFRIRHKIRMEHNTSND